MKNFSFLFIAFFAISCTSVSQPVGFGFKKDMPKKLKEISGIVVQGKFIWAISDRPHPLIFKLNQAGEVVQEVKLKDVTVSDVEAITSDGTYLYVGDVGDNDGNRKSRSIYKTPIAGIGNGIKPEVESEQINFTFADEEPGGKKKDNDYDCESVLAYKDSLYLFTKRRSDDQSQLYSLPKKPGTYQAKYISTYDTEGLVTDAAVNPSGNQVILTGYDKGHDHTFVIVLSNFKGRNFFSGDKQKISLLKKSTEWQIEGITFKDNKVVYLSCEETKEVPATLYAIEIAKLDKLKPKDIK